MDTLEHFTVFVSEDPFRRAYYNLLNTSWYSELRGHPLELGFGMYNGTVLSELAPAVKVNRHTTFTSSKINTQSPWGAFKFCANLCNLNSWKRFASCASLSWEVPKTSIIINHTLPSIILCIIMYIQQV